MKPEPDLRQRFDFATEAAGIGFWFCDLPFDKLHWDARVKEHFWLPPDAEVDIQLFYKRLHPEDRDRTRRAIEEAIGTGGNYEVQYRTVSPDGRQKWIRALGRTAYANGVAIRFDGVTQDITALKRTSEALQQSEERVRIALENMPLILYTTDRELRYTWMYRPHPKMPLEYMLGKRDDELPTDTDLSELQEFKRSVLMSGVAARREFRFNVEGRLEVYDINAEPLRDASGDTIGLTVAALDVTAVRLAQDVLRKTEKLAVVGRLASSIAHEINNPLESVVNLLYLIRTSESVAEMRAHAQAAEEELSRVSQIVTHSLRFHRQSSAPTREKVSALTDSALALYKGRLQAIDVSVVRDYEEAPPVLCYPGELRQVFANLIGNAVDATAKGKIILRVRERTYWRTGMRGVRVSVADTGHGIDAATLEHLWEPFVTTKEVFGTGLGLWVSAEILARHHARVKVRSCTRKGQSGTVFSIVFPVDTLPVEPTAGA